MLDDPWAKITVEQLVDMTITPDVGPLLVPEWGSLSKEQQDFRLGEIRAGTQAEWRGMVDNREHYRIFREYEHMEESAKQVAQAHGDITLAEVFSNDEYYREAFVGANGTAEEYVDGWRRAVFNMNPIDEIATVEQRISDLYLYKARDAGIEFDSEEENRMLTDFWSSEETVNNWLRINGEPDLDSQREEVYQRFDAIASRVAARTKRMYPGEIETLPEALQDFLGLDNGEGEDEEISLRKVGTVESLHQGTEPLPPTEVTVDAQDRLVALGLSEGQISDLALLASSFRYDLAEQKAEMLRHRFNWIRKIPGEPTEVVLPDFFDFDERLAGTHTDMNIRFLMLLHETGYLEDLNQTLKDNGKAPLLPVIAHGIPPTHFNTREDRGVTWVGLVAKGAPVEEMVTIDVAFQQISAGDNGYIMRDHEINPTQFVQKPAAALDVGSYEEIGISDELVIPHLELKNTVVLGISSDREVVYTLGFVEYTATNEIKPVIEAILPHTDPKEFEPIRMINGSGGVVSEGEDQLNEKQRQEMRAILAVLKETDMYLHENQRRSGLAKRQEVQINLFHAEDFSTTTEEAADVFTDVPDQADQIPPELKEMAVQGLKEITEIDAAVIEEISSYEELVSIFGNLGPSVHFLLRSANQEGKPYTHRTEVSLLNKDETDGGDQLMLISYNYDGPLFEDSASALKITSMDGFIDFISYSVPGNPIQEEFIEYGGQKLPAGRQMLLSDFEQASVDPVEIRQYAQILHQFSKDFLTIIEGPDSI